MSGLLVTRTLFPMETGVTSPGGQQADNGPAGPAGAIPGQDRLRSDRAQRWLARLAFLLAGLAVIALLVFAGLRSIAMLGVGLGGATVSLAAAYSALSHRGAWRWLAVTAFALAPVAVIIVYAFAALLWVALLSAALWLLAAATARSALAIGQPDWRMPEYPAAAPAAHPFLIMNPRSGGGKVGKFDLERKAAALGARVFLMSGGEVDVAAVAAEAIDAGADLLGAAGGDGTQALVAGIAAQRGIPFMVISAGTRNHFALDLGLDRDDPSTCLDALLDGVDLLVDLGEVGGRTFVNNASFGAYAEVVDTPAYRGDKLATTLDLLPDLLQGQSGARLRANADGSGIEAPQALLVANNPYGTGDLAGLSRRARLDRGVLSVVAITIDSARQAAGLFRGRHATGLTILTAQHVTVTANTPRIPVGIDGEAVLLPAPIRCSIRPGALRVRVPRHRPGVRPPKPPLNWAQLRRVAALRRPRSLDSAVATPSGSRGDG
jgi:diacylglycerol kinase family enzyme